MALPSSLFSTKELSHHDRFEAWRESIGIFLDARLPSCPSSTIFDACLQSFLLEDVMLSRCTAGAQNFSRNGPRIAQDSIDHYMIQLFISGHVENVKSQSGDRMRGLVAFDLAETMDTFNTDFDLIAVIIPRRRLAPLLTHPDSLQGIRADPQTGPARLLANYLVTLLSIAPTLSITDGRFAVRSLLELVALTFNGAMLTKSDIPDVARPAELLRVQNFIKERLGQTNLDPDFVADGVGMSRAQLYRLFAPVGGISDFIREQRLRRCLADLLSQEHRQIGEIAHRWGFRGSISFTRAFKQRFGRTPSEARAAALSSTWKQEGMALDDRIGDRIYEQWIVNLA